MIQEVRMHPGAVLLCLFAFGVFASVGAEVHVPEIRKLSKLRSNIGVIICSLASLGGLILYVVLARSGESMIRLFFSFCVAYATGACMRFATSFWRARS